MKRIFCALLAAAMLLLPCMALADVILEPEDSFYKRHRPSPTQSMIRSVFLLYISVISVTAVSAAYLRFPHCIRWLHRSHSGFRLSQ